RVSGRLALAVAGAAVAGGAGVLKVATSRRRRAGARALDSRPEPVAGRPWTVLMPDGATLHGVTAGSGRPLVLVHGVTLGLDVWHNQLRDLHGDFRVIAYDQRGHGRADFGSEPLTVPRLARDLAHLLDSHELTDAVLVGHSLGGMVALQMARDLPEVMDRRVSALMLLSTSAGPLTPLPPPAWQRVVHLSEPAVRRVLEQAARRTERMATEEDFAFLAARVSFGRDPDPADVELARRLGHDSAPRVLADLWDSMLNIDLSEACVDLRLPAMVVVGSRDVLTPPRMARAMARRIRGAELVVLPGCGHMPMLERRHDLACLVRTLADSSRTAPA
ncbi:MAG TPA: alpha/beta hydrolase, partial [Acidimicrobiales bacterium]|nr:alpha/beta hydrolase [Acidimicrobiales bacterium]